jgi:HD-like signal output (HDOD) protein
MQLLLVDSDRQFVSLLERVVGTLRPTWRVRSAADAETALRLLDVAPADAVACEVRGTPGRELLEALRTRHPGALRLALATDSARVDGVSIALLAHRILDRPCTGSDLVATLERAHALRAMLDDPVLRAAVGGMTTLPTPPETLLAFEEELADPGTTLERLARIVERDPGTTAAVVRMANTPLFRRAQEAATALDALRALGTQLVRGIVITHAVASRLAGCSAGVSLEQWQERSMQVATTARELARRLARIELQREAFIAGLLHDVGTMVMACGAPEQLQALRARAASHDECVATAAHAIGQPPVSAVGAYLLALWGIPVQIVEAVAAWHDPSRLPCDDVDAALAVHVADALVERPGFGARTVDPALLAARRRGAEVEAWMAAASALRD